MKLRQKLFAAILAVMAVVFLLLALTSILDGLRAERKERELRRRIERGVAQSFKWSASYPGNESWRRFVEVMAEANVCRTSVSCVAGESVK